MDTKNQLAYRKFSDFPPAQTPNDTILNGEIQYSQCYYLLVGQPSRVSSSCRTICVYDVFSGIYSRPNNYPAL